MARRDADVAAWALRGAWVAMFVAAEPVISRALAPASAPVRLTGLVLAALGWALATVAGWAPHPVTLTALRLLSPAALVTVVAAVVAVSRPDVSPGGGWLGSVLALVSTAAAAGLSLSHPVARRWVNGPAYPNERRFPLRAPGPVLLGAGPVLATTVVGGVVAGPMLLAGTQWLVGGVALALGWTLAWFGAKALHVLSRRWVVFVPAGIVLHDPMALADPVLFHRQSVLSVGLAEQGTGGRDLTQKAMGVALELVLEKPAKITLVRPGNRMGQPAEADRMLFAPSRPGQVLAEATRRRVGTSASTRRANTT
ncbi:MAG: hypothetical protein ACT4OS_02905 [Acidimicrobiales bacterium]